MQPEAQRQDVSEVKDLWSDWKGFYETWYGQVGEELAFNLDNQHYQDDNDRDPQRIKPIDPALVNQTRHKAAQILKASQYFEMRPVDNQDDPQASADGKALMDQVLQDPESEFEDAMEDVVDASLAGRAWACTVGFDPDAGMNGELSFEAKDIRKVFWTPGIKSPHSRRCPTLILEEKMLPREIERMGELPEDRRWKNTQGVLTDSAAQAHAAGGKGGAIQDDNTGANASSETKYATVLFCYERFVKQTKAQKSYRTLAPPDYHMWCPKETCGFRGMPQRYLDVELPQGDGDPCPQCGTTTQRVTTEPIEAEVLAYRKGRRLRIIAPIDGREFYNGPWEFDTRGFTTLVYSPYNHPVNPIPNSDTFYYRSLVCVSDAMLRLGYEQMRKAHGIILAPQDSLFDAYGEPFPFSEHRDVAYYDNDFLTPGAIQWFQPPGLNQAWSAYFQTIQGVFAANKGTGDIGLTQQQSKDIAVGTIRTLVETGEIPVDRHIRRFQRFKSLVLTRAFEIMRSTMTAERAIRVLGPDGVFALRRVRASGLPGYDVVVTAEPTIAQAELDKAQAMKQLAMELPHVRKFIARGMNIPPLWLTELEQAEQAFLQKQAQTQQQPQPQPGRAESPNGQQQQLAGAFQ